MSGSHSPLELVPVRKHLSEDVLSMDRSAQKHTAYIKKPRHQRQGVRSRTSKMSIRGSSTNTRPKRQSAALVVR